MTQCDMLSVHDGGLATMQVYFYCHFPDKLLCVDRRSLAKRFYRSVVDWLEEVTTGVYACVRVATILLTSKGVKLCSLVF